MNLRIPLFCTVLCSFCIFQAIGQSFSYPQFKQPVTSLTSLVPAKWKIKIKASGDLNGDKIADIVLILEYKSAVKETRPNHALNQGHPRILLILFKTANG